MAGRLRSSRMSDSVLEEGLRKGVRDMRDEMNVLIWRIERSRDISQESYCQERVRGNGGSNGEGYEWSRLKDG
jgi:hypothetical protein